MKQRHLQSLINFIYLVETEVAQDDLEDFMETAVELRINGLQYLNQTTLRENDEDAIDVQSSFPEPDEGLFVSLPACTTVKNEKVENDIKRWEIFLMNLLGSFLVINVTIKLITQPI